VTKTLLTFPGAFEVYVNGKLMHSKLESNWFPDPDILADKILDEHQKHLDAACLPPAPEPAPVVRSKNNKGLKRITCCRQS
jgi:hypothetical protein